MNLQWSKAYIFRCCFIFFFYFAMHVSTISDLNGPHGATFIDKNMDKVNLWKFTIKTLSRRSWWERQTRKREVVESSSNVDKICSGVGPHLITSLHIYTFGVSRAFMAGAPSQTGDADSSRAHGLTSGLQGSVNVPPWCSIVGATVTVHQFLCVFRF